MKKVIVSVCLSAMAALASAAQFQVTWTNHGPQPLSPLFWSVGDATFDIFQLGTMSNAGIKAIAESGDVAPMLGIAAGAGSAVQLYGVLGPGPLMPGNSRTATIDVMPGADYFSFATMLGMTNDGFLGESMSSMGLRLFGGSTPLGFSVNIFGARAWDAGTELNTQDMADLAALGGPGNPADSSSAIRVHESIIAGRGDSFALLPDWNADTMLTTVTVIPVPEPGTYAALGLGVMALAVRRRHKRSR